MAYGYSLWEAEKTKDFTEPLAYAEALYRKDADPQNPNTACKAFWPSTAAYMMTFYRIGALIGETASEHLDRITDPELRLFTQIEFAASLCGLPALRTMRQERHDRRA